MIRVIAWLKLALVIVLAVAWSLFVPLSESIDGFIQQITLAFVLTVVLFRDVGGSSAFAFVKALLLTMIWFWVVTLVLFQVGWADAHSLLIPVYFYSTMIGVNTLIRRIQLKDMLNLLAPGKPRTALIIIRVFFDTAGPSVLRIAWYEDMLSAHLRPLPVRKAIKVLCTVLAMCVWLFRDVPAKMAIVENRERHLEAQT